MKQEMQHWLSRNRPPRVQITYDVESLGATVKEEIPFIAGIMGDFAGDTTQPPLAERSFVEIDRDNFGDVMARLAPTRKLGSKPRYQVSRAPAGNTYTPDSNTENNFPVKLSFQKMEDFAPPALIAQVPALKSLLDTRQSLTDLMAKLGTDPTLEKQLLTAASGSTMAPAVAALAAANTALTAPGTGTVPLFAAASEAVATAETDAGNKKAATDAGTAVNNAMTTATTGFAALFAVAKGAAATPADIAKANDALQIVLGALQDGAGALVKITAAYDPTVAAQQAVLTAVAKAGDSVDALVPLAWQATLYGNSLKTAPPPATAPTPPPSPS